MDRFDAKNLQRTPDTGYVPVGVEADLVEVGGGSTGADQDDEFIALSRLRCLGEIDFKRSCTPVVRAQTLAIEPDGGCAVNGFCAKLDSFGGPGFRQNNLLAESGDP